MVMRKIAHINEENVMAAGSVSQPVMKEQCK